MFNFAEITMVGIERTVVAVLVAVVSAAFSLIKIMTPIIKNNTIITETLSKVTEELKILAAQNKESHRDIYNKLDRASSQLADHETRISVVEHKILGG